MTKRDPQAARSLIRLFLLVAAFSALAAWEPVATADPRLMPQPALLPHYSPLCDSNLVGCLDIDDFGAHVYGHLMVLPKTDQRDTAAVFPYGVTLGLFGRFAGGVATDFSFWRINGQAESQHGPVRLNLTALLWPLLPFSQAPQMTREDDGATHYKARASSSHRSALRTPAPHRPFQWSECARSARRPRRAARHRQPNRRPRRADREPGSAL